MAYGFRYVVRWKRPGKARPNQLSNSRLEFHQTTYQKPYPIRQPCIFLSRLGGRSVYTLENVVDGYCEGDCNAVGIFFAVFGLFGLAGSTTRLPGLIVSLRVVEKRDKAASFTLTVSECYLCRLC